MRTVVVVAVALVALSGCTMLGAQPYHDNGRTEISPGDWQEAAFEVLPAGGATLSYEVNVESGSRVNVWVISHNDVEAWLDGKDVGSDCGGWDTRAWQESCHLEQGAYSLLIENASDRHSLVEYKLTLS